MDEDEDKNEDEWPVGVRMLKRLDCARLTADAGSGDPAYTV